AENLGGMFSTGDRSAILQSRSANHQCDAGSRQCPEANIHPNRRFIGISLDLIGE
ncbi:hypothetical protein HAX54_012560, partial [Datura stramonium]|nr:hypothetical protein [Datura stramonium]